MLEKLDLMVRFWDLTARHSAGGQPLSPDEQVELLSWLRLVTKDVDDTPEQLLDFTRSGGDVTPAQVIGAGTSNAVEIRAVLARSLVVTSAAPLPFGASVLLRAIDAVAGVEYLVPCVVRWVEDASPCSAMLVVDGIPARKAFGARVDPQVTQAWGKPTSAGFGAPPN